MGVRRSDGAKAVDRHVAREEAPGHARAIAETREIERSAQPPTAPPQPETRPAVAEKPAEKPEPHKRRVKGEKPEKVEAAPAQAAAQPDAAPAQPTTGIVLITVKPWADVTINGKHLGNSPIPAQELAAGAYEAVFTNPAVDHPVKRKFTVVAGQQVNVDVNMDAP